MIQARLQESKYPAAATLVVDSLPQENEIISVFGWGYYRVQRVCKRWESDYIYLQNLYNNVGTLEGYLKVK